MEAAILCFVVLLAFCFLASMGLMQGYYSPVKLLVTPGCSRLVQASSFLVQGIRVKIGEEGGSRGGGPVLYGMAGIPRLDMPASWSETRRVIVPANSHREWVYFLNKGSQIEIVYSVNAETELPYRLCIIIAQGMDSFTQWTEQPSVDNTTLSWRLVHGNGTVTQNISSSYEYYIAVGNLNDHNTTVLLNFTFRAVLYNTTGADYACSPSPGDSCMYRLPILGQNVAVLSSDLKRLNSDDEEQPNVELSYAPRWIMYAVGSAILAITLPLLYEILSSLIGLCTWSFLRRRAGASTAEQRAPLLTNKEEEGGSLGSSYDSLSHDDDEENNVEGRDEEQHLCVVCCDARKDCFFLPCGHSATCYACGTRILEGDCSCPFCRRKLKKVRRIFAV